MNMTDKDLTDTAGIAAMFVYTAMVNAYPCR